MPSLFVRVCRKTEKSKEKKISFMYRNADRFVELHSKIFCSIFNTGEFYYNKKNE